MRLIKALCESGKWSEAIACAARLTAGSKPDKASELLFVAGEVISKVHASIERDKLLVKLIEAFLSIGRTEYTRNCLLALVQESLREKFAVAVKETLELRRFALG